MFPFVKESLRIKSIQLYIFEKVIELLPLLLRLKPSLLESLLCLCNVFSDHFNCWNSDLCCIVFDCNFGCFAENLDSFFICIMQFSCQYYCMRRFPKDFL